MSTTGQTHAVRLERNIPASPDRVYRAWLEPDLIRRWLAPGGLRATRVDVDERVGGRYRIWHSMGEDAAGGFECEITELVPNERIALRWGFVGPERTGGPVFDSLLTVTFRAAPGGATALTLVHERLEELAAAMPDVAKSVEPGWDDVLKKLAATASRGKRRCGK